MARRGLAVVAAISCSHIAVREAPLGRSRKTRRLAAHMRLLVRVGSGAYRRPRRPSAPYILKGLKGVSLLLEGRLPARLVEGPARRPRQTVISAAELVADTVPARLDAAFAVPVLTLARP